MCGIVGFITTEKHKGASDRRKFLENALVAGTVRGDDSTGIFLVKHEMKEQETADWYKIAGDGYSMLTAKQYQDLTTYTAITGMRAVIGHNRAATVGSVTADNAHPFQEGPITLVHNGTLHSTYGLGKSLHQLKDQGVEVDSHAICHNLAEAANPKDVIEKLDGAFTLVWHDARNNTINMVRNEKRPIHLLFAKCEDTVLIASEAEMLHWLAKRNNFAEGTIVYPKPGELLTFHPDSLVPEVVSVPLHVPTERPASGYGRGWSTAGTTNWRRNSAPWEGKDDKLAPLPKVAEEQLMELDIDGNVHHAFIPTKATEVLGLKYGVVSGFLTTDTGAMPAVVHGVLFDAVKTAAKNEEVWTVRPIAVKSVREKDEDVPVVVCRLVRREWREATKKEKDAKRQTNFASRLGSRTPHEYVPGPHDEWIPVHEWIANTADGCVQCGVTLCADDAEDIEWVQGKSRAMCPGCVADNEQLMALDRCWVN